MIRVLGPTLVLAFASWLTVHLFICVQFLGGRPRWRGLICLVPPLAPLAPYWAFRQGRYGRAALWAASGTAYLALLYAAYI